MCTEKQQKSFMIVVCSKDGKIKTIDVKRAACLPPINLLDFDQSEVNIPRDALDLYKSTTRDSMKWHDVRIKFSKVEWFFDATVKSFKETEGNMLRIVFMFHGIINYIEEIK